MKVSYFLYFKANLTFTFSPFLYFLESNFEHYSVIQRIDDQKDPWLHPKPSLECTLIVEIGISQKKVG